MGISKEVKDAIRALYPHTIRNCRSIKEFVKSIEPPVAPNFQFPTIVLFDYTAKLKYYPKDRVRNGHEYFENWFLPPIATAYEDGASVVYVCFDRGSPINKDLEHKKRYRDTEFMEIPNFDGETIITDTYIPPPEEWEGFVNNKQLVGELIHYVTQRLLDEQADLEHTFSPPPGKVLNIHGGRTFKPNRHVFPILLPEPAVFYVESALEERKRLGGITDLIPKRHRDKNNHYPSNELEYLLEAEVACLYFARHHSNENCLFVTPDGDMLLQLLLMAPDRIDPVTGNFRNCHFLRLTLDGNDDFVDINALYSAIITDKKLAAYQNPVLAFVALSSLLKNDYIHNFCPGVKTCHGEPPLSGYFTDINVPIVYQVMYGKAPKYGKLFSHEPIIRMNENTPCLIHINEKLWVEFVNDCYLTKYKTAASRKAKINPSAINIDDVRNLLSSYKNRDNDIMSRSRTLVFCRQLLWLLEYWHNGYRGSCMTYPPHALYKDKSYYGWMINASSECLPAEEVSDERPNETKSINKMFKKKWKELESVEEEEEVKRGIKRKNEEELSSEKVKKARRFHVEKVIRNHADKYKIRKHLPELQATPIMSPLNDKVEDDIMEDN